MRFARLPTSERDQITGGVPTPIADVKWNDAVLWASSDQGVGRQISATHGPKASHPAELTASNRFRAAASNKVADAKVVQPRQLARDIVKAGKIVGSSS